LKVAEVAAESLPRESTHLDRIVGVRKSYGAFEPMSRDSEFARRHRHMETAGGLRWTKLWPPSAGQSIESLANLWERSTKPPPLSILWGFYAHYLR
jgi:hypothetical protein